MIFPEIEKLLQAPRALRAYERSFDLPIWRDNLKVTRARLDTICWLEPGDGCWDCLQTSVQCLSCGSVFMDTMTVVEEHSPYDCYSGMCLLGLDVGFDVVGQEPYICKKCRKPVTTFVEIHHYDSGRIIDVVCRWSWSPASGAPVYQLLTMDHLGQYEYADLDEFPVGQDAVITTVESQLAWALDVGDMEAYVEMVKFALRECPDYERLVAAGDVLYSRIEMRGLVEAIAQSHIAHFPHDFGGYSLLASLYLAAYDGSDLAVVNEAYKYAFQSLKLNPFDYNSEAVLFNCLRFAGRPYEEVAQAFYRLIANHPGKASPYYDFAMHHLDFAPAEAESLFKAGSRLAPDEPDYLVGQARALTAMDRKIEAREILAKAQKMESNNPMLPELLAQLGPLGS